MNLGVMKCFTWESPNARPSAGISVVKTRRDPANYADYLAPHVFIMGKRFWNIRSTCHAGVPPTAPTGRQLSSAEILCRLDQAAPYAVCLLEQPPDVFAGAALVVAPFGTQLVTPENESSVVYKSDGGVLLFSVELDTPLSFGDHTLLFNGESLEVYDTKAFFIWQRVMASFDFSVPPEADEED